MQPITVPCLCVLMVMGRFFSGYTVKNTQRACLGGRWHVVCMNGCGAARASDSGMHSSVLACGRVFVCVKHRNNRCRAYEIR